MRKDERTKVIQYTRRISGDMKNQKTDTDSVYYSEIIFPHDLDAILAFSARFITFRLMCLYNHEVFNINLSPYRQNLFYRRLM